MLYYGDSDNNSGKFRGRTVLVMLAVRCTDDGHRKNDGYCPGDNCDGDQ